MPIRYYPSFRVKTGLITNGLDFMVNGVPYKGKYYETFDGKYFTGDNPVFGPNLPLQKIDRYSGALGLDSITSNPQLKKQLASGLNMKREYSGQPTSYFPLPTEDNYRKGYFTRYFVKKINDNGYVTEISYEEYTKINEGTVLYDVSPYKTGEMMWKLVGPTESKRLSQYDIREGIIPFNKRMTETLEKTMVGIKSFVGDNYLRFARPTT